MFSTMIYLALSCSTPNLIGFDSFTPTDKKAVVKAVYLCRTRFNQCLGSLIKTSDGNYGIQCVPSKTNK